jgi:hypothetical protein
MGGGQIIKPTIKKLYEHEQGAERSELHPFFTRGEWEGFIPFTRGAAEKHPMHFTLLFKDNVVTGTGGDKRGQLVLEGAYCKDN